MRTTTWIAGLGIGALMLTSALLAGPIAGLAQGDGTPPPAEESTFGDAVLDPAIGLIEAQELALAGQEGAAVRSVDLDRRNNDRLVWSVDLDNGVEVEIDGSSGEILEIDDDHDDDDDDD